MRVYEMMVKEMRDGWGKDKDVDEDEDGLE